MEAVPVDFALPNMQAPARYEQPDPAKRGPMVDVSFAPTQVFKDHFGEQEAAHQAEKFAQEAWQQRLLGDSSTRGAPSIYDMPKGKEEIDDEPIGTALAATHKYTPEEYLLVGGLLGMAVGSILTYIAIKALSRT